MEQSNFFELVKTLDSDKIQQIRQFSTISFFNHGRYRTQVIALLELCFKHVLGQTRQTLEKKSVYASIFPKQEYREGKLEQVMAAAHKVLRNGLQVMYYFREENEFYQAFDFAGIASSNGMDTQQQQLLTRLKKSQNEVFPKNEAHYLKQLLLEDAIHDIESLHNQVRGDLNIPNVLQALDQHYHLTRFSRLNRFLLQQKAASLNTPEVIQRMLAETKIPERYLSESLLIRINYEIFKLLRKPILEPSDIQVLFDLLLQHETIIDPISLREFYTYLRSLCVLVSNTFFDNEEIRLTLFELYKDNLSRGYLHIEGKMTSATYLAVSVSAIRVKQLDWALHFIESHKHEIIGENETQDIYRFNMAIYLFGAGRYAECLDSIPATSPLVDYLLNGKRLELKAMYELRSDLLPYKLDAFKMFLSRTSPKLLSEIQKRGNQDFANLLLQLIQSPPDSADRAQRMTHRVQEKKQTLEGRWLLEKAKALKKG